MHGHALFQITHNTRVRMQFATYKSFCAKALGLKSVYFHAKLLPKDTASTLSDVRRYIGKDQHIPTNEQWDTYTTTESSLLLSSPSCVAFF